MIGKVRYLFVFICVFSLASLTMQAAVINFCKETKAVKIQKQTVPVTEEEEERSHDNDEVDEVLYFTEHEKYSDPNYNGYIQWLKTEHHYLSCVRKIPIPPPKCLIP